MTANHRGGWGDGKDEVRQMKRRPKADRRLWKFGKFVYSRSVWDTLRGGGGSTIQKKEKLAAGQKEEEICMMSHGLKS